MENIGETLDKSRLEYLWKTYASIVDWIKFSDTKAGAVLAANGVIVGLTLSNASAMDTLTSKNAIFTLLVLIGGIALYGSSILCLLALIPKLSVGEPSSIIFFAHIAKRSRVVEEYHSAVDTVFDDKREEAQVKDQIWAISRVAKRKYHLVGWGMWLFAGMVFTTLIFIFLAIVIP